MPVIRRKFVDWDKTGKNIQLLREDNIELRRCVCGALKKDKSDCTTSCDECKFEMDKHISRKELAEVFGTTDNIIFNWETGKTPVDYENLLFYSQLSKLELDDIIVFID